MAFTPFVSVHLGIYPVVMGGARIMVFPCVFVSLRPGVEKIPPPIPEPLRALRSLRSLR